MDVFAPKGLKRPHFTKPPALSVWRRRTNGLYALDPGDPVPSVWPARVGRYWITREGRRLPVLAGGSEMSDYLENNLADHLLRTNTFAKPGAAAIALATATIVDSDTGASITEVANANAYARLSKQGDANWTAPAGGSPTTSNAAAFTFAQATGAWGTVTDVAITDSATWGAGNLLLYSALTTSKPINNGDTAEFATGALDVTFD